jgi:hypothetical protein
MAFLGTVAAGIIRESGLSFLTRKDELDGYNHESAPTYPMRTNNKLTPVREY